MRTDTVRTSRTRAPGSSRTPHERRRIGGGVFTVRRFDHGTHGRLAKSRSTPCDGAATARRHLGETRGAPFTRAWARKLRGRIWWLVRETACTPAGRTIRACCDSEAPIVDLDVCEQR